MITWDYIYDEINLYIYDNIELLNDKNMMESKAILKKRL